MIFQKCPSFLKQNEDGIQPADPSLGDQLHPGGHREEGGSYQRESEGSVGRVAAKVMAACVYFQDHVLGAAGPQLGMFIGVTQGRRWVQP